MEKRTQEYKSYYGQATELLKGGVGGRDSLGLIGDQAGVHGCVYAEVSAHTAVRLQEGGTPWLSADYFGCRMEILGTPGTSCREVEP